jgi:hypothetical protein
MGAGTGRKKLARIVPFEIGSAYVGGKEHGSLAGGGDPSRSNQIPCFQHFLDFRTRASYK